jgi:hypothetical protein
MHIAWATSTGCAALIFASATFAVAAHSCSLDFFFSAGVGDVADLLALLPALMAAVPPPLQKAPSSPSKGKRLVCTQIDNSNQVWKKEN